MGRIKLGVILFSVSFILISAGIGIKRLDYRKAKNNNVCKELKSDVLIYAIFVDNKQTSPWTEYDIQSTLDSISVATNWIRKQAIENGYDISIKSDYYIGEEFSTIKRKLPEETIKQTIEESNLSTGIKALNKWADQIARKAGVTFNINDKEGIPEIKNPKNKERLLAYLRDEHKTENVALMFCVNNYYKEDISISVNTMSSNDVEFSIISYKYPAVIAHNLLQLFGAADLHESPFRRIDRNISLANEQFPNDIMQNPMGKDINNLTIGEYTKYLIGWEKDLDEKYHDLLFDKRIKLK